MTMSESMDAAAPSPVHYGRNVGPWQVGARFAVRGDLHLHHASGPGRAEMAVWRYRGSQPLPRFLQDLTADLEAWGELRHGNLAPVLDIGRVTGELTCYWTQESPGGSDLSSRFAAHPVMAPASALHISLQLAHALVEVHRNGLVHGDLDPANVWLMGTNDRVRLGWGGLAPRIEAAGMDSGRGGSRSLAEVAPEALDGGPAGHTADIYGLGALLFRMVAGRPPFMVQTNGRPPGLDPREACHGLPLYVPADLASLLARSLRRDPAQRPDLQTVLHVLIDVERRLRDEPDPTGAWTGESESGSAPAPVSPSMVPPPPREYDAALANDPHSVEGSYRGAPPRLHTLPPSSPPHAPAAVAARPPRRPRRRNTGFGSLLVGLVGLGLLGAGGVATVQQLWPDVELPELPDMAALFGRDPGPPPLQIPVQVAPVAQIAPTTPAPEVSVLTLNSTPPGALVVEGSTPIGRTPLEVPLSGGPRDPPRQFTIELEGYAPHTVTQPWTNRSNPVHHVPLAALPAPAPAPVPAAAPRPVPVQARRVPVPAPGPARAPVPAPVPARARAASSPDIVEVVPPGSALPLRPSRISEPPSDEE